MKQRKIGEELERGFDSKLLKQIIETNKELKNASL